MRDQLEDLAFPVFAGHDPELLRLHADCHPGNVLWTEQGPHFVDFDDARMGPAIQDIWMLLGADDPSLMEDRFEMLMEGYEEFVAWESGKRMAFTFVGSNKNATDKFLEDYRVTDLGDGTCRVEWYMAMEPRGFSRHMMWLTRPIMRFANRRMFRKFKAYTEERASVSEATPKGGNQLAS